MKLNKDDHAHTTSGASHIYISSVKADMAYAIGLGKDIFNNIRQLLQIVVIVCFKHKSK